jgi:hypothetical protein
MGKEPYRLSAERNRERPDERLARDASRLDPMVLYTLAFVLVCAAGRAWISWRQRAIDDDVVLALGAGGAAGWGLVAAWVKRKRKA